jgi:hypothetical protein
MIEFATPQELFGGHYATVLDLMAAHSPFPQGKSNAYSKDAKMRAARIHLDETVFFAQVAYHDLQPKDTVELCAGFGIPSITLNKLFGVTSVCVDSDSEKMRIGAMISKMLNVPLPQEKQDVFFYLRKNVKDLDGKTLLATAAYCRDKKKGRPMGSGEKDIVRFAKAHRVNLALLPFRTGDIITKGFSSEKNRTQEYDDLLREAGFRTQSHSTEPLFRGLGAPDWFFMDILTAKSKD